MWKSASSEVEYAVRCRRKLLEKLETELEVMEQAAKVVSSEASDAKEGAVESVQQAACAVRRQAEAMLTENLQHLLTRARQSTDIVKMRVATLTQQKSLLEDALRGVTTTAVLVDRARTVQTAELDFACQVRHQDQRANMLQLSTRFQALQRAAKELSEEIVRKAQVDLARSNFVERTRKFHSLLAQYHKKEAGYRPIATAMRFATHRSEASALRKQLDKIYSTVQVKTPSAFLEKYFDVLSSNQWLTAKINILLIQQAEARAAKHKLKRELKVWKVPPVPEFRSLPQSPKAAVDKQIEKETIALKLMAFDVSSCSKNILVAIDKMDPYSELGPHFADLRYSQDGITDHCIAVLMLVEKKVALCKELIQLKTSEVGKSPHPLSRSPLRQSLFIHAVQSVNTLKNSLYTTHFVENSPVRIESILHGVAQIHYQAVNELKPLQAKKPTPAVANDPTGTDRSEENYVRLEQKQRKRDRCSSQELLTRGQE